MLPSIVALLDPVLVLPSTKASRVVFTAAKTVPRTAVSMPIPRAQPADGKNQLMLRCGQRTAKYQALQQAPHGDST